MGLQYLNYRRMMSRIKLKKGHNVGDLDRFRRLQNIESEKIALN
jgi:hypothetical protein